MAFQSSSGLATASLDELSAFVAVVEAQGFSAAARLTGGRKATFSQRVQDLEARLGVALLVRTTRSLRLTDEGRGYYEHARRALSAARDAEAIVLAAKSEPTGTLRITTSAALSASVLELVIGRYLIACPKVSAHLDISDTRIDLVREGFDLAIRMGPLADSSMMARRLGALVGGYYASPRYLARRGVPQHPERLLEQHDAIVVPKDGGPPEWHFAIGGKKRTVAVKPRLAVANLEFAVQAAASGLGIVRAPEQLAEPYVAKRQLQRVLRDWTLPAVEVNAVFPPGGMLVPKTRVFLDMLMQWFEEYEAQTERPRSKRAQSRGAARIQSVRE